MSSSLQKKKNTYTKHQNKHQKDLFIYLYKDMYVCITWCNNDVFANSRWATWETHQFNNQIETIPQSILILFQILVKLQKNHVMT